MAAEEVKEAKVWTTHVSKKTRVDLSWKPGVPNNAANNNVIAYGAANNAHSNVNNVQKVGDMFNIDLPDEGVTLKISLRIAERKPKLNYYDPEMVVVEMTMGLPLQQKIASVSWCCSPHANPFNNFSGLSFAGIGHLDKLTTTKEISLSGSLHTIYVAFEFKLEEKDCVDALTHGLKNMMDSSVLTDVVLVCEGKEFPCHRNVLAAQSAVFNAMLVGDSFKESKDGIVKIDDMTAEELKIMLNFLYNKDATELRSHPDLGMKLLAKADKYELHEFVDKCAECLESCLNQDNVFEVVTLATMHNVPKLQQAATKYIMANGKGILGTFGK